MVILGGHGTPEAWLACGASASSLTVQMVQPCADSAGHSRLAQCLHRYSSPRRAARYTARTAGPHRSHVSFISWLLSGKLMLLIAWCQLLLVFIRHQASPLTW